MVASYPPSPSVENEEAALAHEHGLHPHSEPSKSDDQPAGSRGTVDQYPIILDVDSLAARSEEKPVTASGSKTVQKDNEHSSLNSESSDGSLGPPTPTTSNVERRFIHIPDQASEAPTPSEADLGVPPFGYSEQPRENTAPRGRPKVGQIRTDLGGDLQQMISGRRRAPSPYAYKAAENSEPISKRQSGDNFLSPEHAIQTQKIPTKDAKRPSSARPPGRPEDLSSFTNSEKRRRSHSRRRASNGTFSRPERPTLNPSLTYSHPMPQKSLPPHEHQHHHRAIRSDQPTLHRWEVPKDSPYPSADEANTKRRNEHVEREENGLAGDSPSTPAQDSSSRHHIDPLGRQEKRSSRDSPYTSSAEESLPRSSNRHSLRRTGGRTSQHGSVHSQERAHQFLRTDSISMEAKQSRLESNKHRHEPAYSSLVEGRTFVEQSTLSSPTTVEDYLDKAFRDKTIRGSYGSLRASPAASPRPSPPQTPPRAPRGDGRPRDYSPVPSALPSHTPTASQQRSRPRSSGEIQSRALKPLTSIHTPVPNGSFGSRSSASPMDLHYSGPPSKFPSGNSSNDSPVREESRSSSRTNSFARYEPKPPARSPTFSHQEDRLLSATSSHAPLPLEIPRLAQRASSYSAMDNGTNHRRANTYRSPQDNLTSVMIAEAASNPVAPRLTRSSPSSSEKIAKAPAPRTDPNTLPPCPRSTPVGGYYDWYTIRGIAQVDLCPTCMTAIGGSRFRDYFVPSLPKPRGTRTRCALSEPWIRNAWIQTMKQHRPSLEMLYQLIHLRSTTKSCPGKASEVRSWYRLIDPGTGIPVPNFDACAACVRSVEIIFPQLKGVFQRSSSLVQERTCDLNCNSKRFAGYMNRLEEAATRFDVDRLREPDISAFADHARRTARLRECTRDDMVLVQAWHFMPQLPELTICEECFQEVVWPVIDQPIAKHISRTLQLVPATREGAHTTGISCQLYTDRMRKKFLEAVRYDDFECLRRSAVQRYRIEKLLQEKHRLLLRDVAKGRDRTTELQKNIEEWKLWE